MRAERDVLQARMSEQALKISSLSARLQQQRNDAEALSHQATSQLSVQLHDALAEVRTTLLHTFYTKIFESIINYERDRHNKYVSVLS